MNIIQKIHDMTAFTFKSRFHIFPSTTHFTCRSFDCYKFKYTA